MGASIEMYLLDQVRLLKQASGEPNEMFFYEILADANKEEKDISGFYATSTTGTFDKRDGVKVKDSDTY